LRTVIIVIAFNSIFCCYSFSQNDSSDIFSGTAKVTAGKEYDISGLKEIIFGAHWRDLWKTPFSVDIINLEKYGGGLTPIKKGGGLQTKSLRFKGNDSLEYKFRSMNKDPSRILPEEYQNSVFADMVKDQISTSHPFSAVIVSPIMNAVGILNAEPFVIVLPNDKRLGKYRKEFGGMLGTIELNPEGSDDENNPDEKGFGNADKIISTDKLYKKLEDNNDNQVDNIEYLKARLIDLLIGDWDRHSDQWKWAGYKEKGRTVYKPIPRDRDQAFSLYDGLIPFLVGESITQIEGYSEDYPKIYDLTFNGRYIDRKFLPPVPKSDYDSLVKYIQQQLTDSVITYAVKKMPKEWYGLGGKKLERLIRSRRNKLKSASDEYYNLINEIVDVYGSDKNEFVAVNYFSENELELRIYETDKETGEIKGDPFFKRNFNDDDTKEIRIYLNNGKDIVDVKGNYSVGIDINLIKSEGEIEILNLKDRRIYERKDIRPKDDLTERNEPENEDRGYDWRFGPVFDYNTDDGLVLGGGPILYKYGYNFKPYAFKMSLFSSYSFKYGKFNFDFDGNFYNIIRNQNVIVDFTQSELFVTKFFGMGNETTFNKDLENSGYYNVKQEYLESGIGVDYYLGKNAFMESGLSYSYSDVIYDPNTLLGQNPNTYGIGSMKFGGMNLGMRFDSRNSQIETNTGIYSRLNGKYYPQIFSNSYEFGKAEFDIRGYLSTDTLMGATLVMQAAGGKIWGTFPFNESLFLGGEGSLLGFARERFAGNGLIMAQSELRIRLLPLNILVPGILGISVFGGTGRVYLQGEKSKTWHNSYGGSVWISYINKLANFGITVAQSDEGFKFYLGSAFTL